MKYFGIILFALVGIFCSSLDSYTELDRKKPEPAWDYKHQSEYVVILVIDGPRYSETYGDSTRQYIPYLSKYLSKEGTLYTNFKNNGITHTANGHTAITTGVYQRIKNNGTQLPKNPNIFQYYLKAKKVEKSSAYIVSSKGKLEVLANTSDKKWFNAYNPSTYCGFNGDGNSYSGDALTWKKVEEIYTTESVPKLSLINLLGVDVNGHNNNWEGYLKNIQLTDEYAYKLWGMIQSNPVMKGKTTLLITNDHGRHLDGRRSGFVSHGCSCEGCRHISLLAIGPDIKRDHVVTQEGELIDISQTIGSMLNFAVPTSKGRILKEMFIEK